MNKKHQQKVEKIWRMFKQGRRKGDITLLQQALLDFQTEMDFRGVAMCLKNIGAIHYKNNKIEKAIFYYKQAIESEYLSKDNKDNPNLELERSVILYTLSLLLFKEGQVEESEKYTNQIKDRKIFNKTIKLIRHNKKWKNRKLLQRRKLRENESMNGNGSSSAPEYNEILILEGETDNDEDNIDRLIDQHSKFPPNQQMGDEDDDDDELFDLSDEDDEDIIEEKNSNVVYMEDSIESSKVNSNEIGKPKFGIKVFPTLPMNFSINFKKKRKEKREKEKLEKEKREIEKRKKNMKIKKSLRMKERKKMNHASINDEIFGEKDDDMNVKRKSKLEKKRKKKKKEDVEKKRKKIVEKLMDEIEGNRKDYTVSNYLDLLDKVNEILSIDDRNNETKNLRLKSSILNNIGSIYFTEENFDMAKKFYKKTAKIRMKLGDTKNLFIPLNNIGKTYYINEDYERALCYFEEAYQHNKKDLTLILNLGLGHYKLKEYEKCIKYLETYLEMSGEEDEKICFVYKKLSFCYVKIDELQKGFKILKQAIKVCKDEKEAEKIQKKMKVLRDIFLRDLDDL